MRARTFLSLAMVLLIAASLGCVGSSDKKDTLAKCLTEKGAKMYGADWCSHCKNQKNEFGSSFQYVDYVECDPSGPNANPEACKVTGVEGYPTWIIDGVKYPGEQQLSTLAKISGCAY